LILQTHTCYLFPICCLSWIFIHCLDNRCCQRTCIHHWIQNHKCLVWCAPITYP
jgi:hypothetical protein